MPGGRRFQTRRERIAVAVAQEAGMVVENNTVRCPRKPDTVQPSSMAGRRLELTSSEGDVREFLKKHAEKVHVQGENVLISADTGMSEAITSEFEEARTVAEGGRAFSMTPSLRADFDKKAFPTLLDIKRHQVRLFGSAYGMVYSQCWLNEIKRAGGGPALLIRNDKTFNTEAFAKDMEERCARQFCNGVNLKWTPKTKTSEEQLVMSFNDPAMAMVYETHLGHLGPRAPIDECALREFLAVELRHAVAEKAASEDRWAQGSKKKAGAKVNRLLRDLRSGARRPASIGDSNNKGTVLLDDSPKHFVCVGGVVYARRQGLESAQRECRRQYVEVANRQLAALEEKPAPDTSPSWLNQRADLITGRNKIVVGHGGLKMHMSCTMAAMIFFTTQLRNGPRASMEVAVRKEILNLQFIRATMELKDLPPYRVCAHCDMPYRPVDPPEWGNYCGGPCRREARSHQHAEMVRRVLLAGIVECGA